MGTNLKKNKKEKMKLFIKRYKPGFSIVVGLIFVVGFALQTSVGFSKCILLSFLGVLPHATKEKIVPNENINKPGFFIFIPLLFS